MEMKKYPKKELAAVSMSTCVTCGKCNGATGIYEPLMHDGAKYYHLSCVSDDDKETATETKLVTLELTDDLNVKSEGR